MVSSYWELSEAQRAGFDRLFRRYAGAMVSFARSRLGSRIKAEEAVQEAFCALIRRAEEKNLNLCDIRLGLIVYTVKWKIIDIQRRESRERERTLPLEDMQADREDGAEDQAERWDLRLRAADLLGLSRGAVAMRLKRLREKLRKQLEEAEVENNG